MIISIISFTAEEIDELSNKFKFYIMTSAIYTSRGAYKEGDDLEAEYCARQETHQRPELIFTRKSELNDYIKK